MEENDFNNITLETNNPFADIKAIAYNNDDDASEYDFKLLSFTTTCTNMGKTEILNGYKGLEIFDNDEVFLNEKITLSQTYKIEITKSILKKNPLEISLGANKSLTKIIANVKKNLNVNYYEGLEDDIVNEINKKLIKAKVLIGLRTKYMFDGIKTLVNKIKVHGFLSDNFQFVVAVGLESNNNAAGKLKLLYKEKKITHEEEKKIDYANRGFVCAVKEGEIVLEYIKPQKGNDGKNLRGEFIKVAPLDANSNDEKPKVVEEEISVEEYEDKFMYFAAKSGYILVDKDGRYGIKDNLELLKVDFKTTGSIDAGIDKNVKLNIKSGDVTEDAIGSNINVEIEEINVEGSIAQNATIKAVKAEIGGQTHSKSSVYAKDCRIGVHKGYCEGENIEIDKLEGGEVRGVNVRIKQALGGVVYAKSVSIGTLNANSTFYITSDAYVENCQGENNKFIISPSNSKEIKEEIEVLLQEVQVINKDLSGIPAPLKAKKVIIDLNKESIVKIKAKIEELQAQGVEPPKAFFDKLKDFQNTINDYNELVKQEKILNRKLDEHNQALNKIQEKIFETRVMCKSKWKNLNEVKFILDYPKKELAYNTYEGELANIIRLERDMGVKDTLELKINIENTDDICDNLSQTLVGTIKQADDFTVKNQEQIKEQTTEVKGNNTITAKQIDLSKKS